MGQCSWAMLALCIMCWGITFEPWNMLALVAEYGNKDNGYFIFVFKMGLRNRFSLGIGF